MLAQVLASLSAVSVIATNLQVAEDASCLGGVCGGDVLLQAGHYAKATSGDSDNLDRHSDLDAGGVGYGRNLHMLTTTTTTTTMPEPSVAQRCRNQTGAVELTSEPTVQDGLSDFPTLKEVLEHVQSIHQDLVETRVQLCIRLYTQHEISRTALIKSKAAYEAQLAAKMLQLEVLQNVSQGDSNKVNLQAATCQARRDKAELISSQNALMHKTLTSLISKAKLTQKFLNQTFMHIRANWTQYVMEFKDVEALAPSRKFQDYLDDARNMVATQGVNQNAAESLISIGARGEPLIASEEHVAATSIHLEKLTGVLEDATNQLEAEFTVKSKRLIDRKDELLDNQANLNDTMNEFNKYWSRLNLSTSHYRTLMPWLAERLSGCNTFAKTVSEQVDSWEPELVALQSFSKQAPKSEVFPKTVDQILEPVVEARDSIMERSDGLRHDTVAWSDENTSALTAQMREYQGKLEDMLATNQILTKENEEISSWIRETRTKLEEAKQLLYQLQREAQMYLSALEVCHDKMQMMEKFIEMVETYTDDTNNEDLKVLDRPQEVLVVEKFLKQATRTLVPIPDETQATSSSLSQEIYDDITIPPSPGGSQTTESSVDSGTSTTEGQGSSLLVAGIQEVRAEKSSFSQEPLETDAVGGRPDYEEFIEKLQQGFGYLADAERTARQELRKKFQKGMWEFRSQHATKLESVHEAMRHYAALRQLDTDLVIATTHLRVINMNLKAALTGVKAFAGNLAEILSDIEDHSVECGGLTPRTKCKEYRARVVLDLTRLEVHEISGNVTAATGFDPDFGQESREP